MINRPVYLEYASMMQVVFVASGPGGRLEQWLELLPWTSRTVIQIIRLKVYH